MDLEHQRAMRSNARALVERRGSEGGGGHRVTQAARMVTAFMENSFPNFLEGGTTVTFSMGETPSSEMAKRRPRLHDLASWLPLATGASLHNLSDQLC